MDYTKPEYRKLQEGAYRKLKGILFDTLEAIDEAQPENEYDHKSFVFDESDKIELWIISLVESYYAAKAKLKVRENWSDQEIIDEKKACLQNLVKSDLENSDLRESNQKARRA